MTETKLPERIFMAVDLSTGCDRALTRAVLLARSRQIELTPAHAVGAAEVARHDRLGSTAESLRALDGDTLVVRGA